MTLKWTPKEWLNQLAHFSIGGVIFAAVYFTAQIFVGCVWAFPIAHLAVMVVAAGIEMYQYYKKDNLDLRLDDRFRDWCFYQVGAVICDCFIMWFYI